MADNTIDTLELDIKSNSQIATDSLDKLAKKLNEVNRSIKNINNGGLRKLAKEVGTLTGAIKLFSGTKFQFPKISGTTEEIDRMKKYVSNESKKISDTLSDSFQIKGNSKNLIKKQVEDIGKMFAAGDFSKTSEMIDNLGNNIIEISSHIKNTDDEMESFYQTLLKVSKIKVSPSIPKALPDEWKNMDGLLRQKMSTKEGVELDSFIQEWKKGFQGIFSNLNLDTVEDQFIELNRIVKECREGIEQPIDKGMLEDTVWKELVDNVEKFQTSILSAKKVFESTGGTTESKNVGLSNIIRDIKKLSETDTVNLQNIGNSLFEFAKGANEISKIKFDSSSILQAFETIKKIGSNSNIEKTKNLNIVAGNLKTLSQSMDAFSNLANIPDVSNSINRFLSSLQKLANAGDKAKQVETSLPELGRQLKKTTNKFTNLKDISPSINMFVQSIGRLTSAGNKTGQTAGQLKNLANETLDFFNVMKNAPTISQNTIDMTQALAQLASAGGNVSRATNSITKSFSKFSTAGNIAKTALNGIDKIMGFTARNIAKLAGKISESFKRITSSSHGLKTASFNLGNLLKTAIGFRIGYGLLNFGKSAINLGSSITEVQNVVDVAFGSMSGMVDEFARTADEKFGLSELAAKQYSGTMMAMLKSSGVVKQSAAEMSTTLAGLAGDIASFYNIDTDLAFQKIRSGIAGEIEPLRQLGISMTIANLEAFALSQGITKSYQAMTQAEQVMLRYNYLLWASADAQGDFARTSMNWANQVRMLTLNFQQLAATIGQGLIAAILPAVQALNALMGKLMQAAETFRNFIYTLMGKKLEGSQGGIVNDLAGIGDTSTGLENLGSAGGDAASGMEDATGAAQDLKKALSVLSFDELNQLADSASSAGGALGGIGGGGGGLDNIQTPTFGGLSSAFDELGKTDVETPINKWAERIRKAFLAHDWDKLGFEIADGLNRGLKKFYDVINWKNVEPKITAFTEAFTQTFNSFVENFDWDLLGRTVGASVNTVVNTLNQLADGIDWKNIGSKLAEGFNGLVDEIDWYNLGHLIGNKFRIAWDMFSGFVKDLNYAEIGLSVAELLNGAFDTISFGEIGTTLSNLMDGAFEALKNFTKEFEWEDFSNNVAEGISNFLKDTEWEENGAALGDFLLHLGEALTGAITDETFYDLGTGIGEFIGALPWPELLTGAVDTIIGAIASLLQGLWDSDDEGKIAAGISAAFLAIKVANITGISTLAGKIIGHMIEKIQAQEQIDKMTEAFKTIFSTSSQNASTVVTEELGKIGGSVDDVGGKAVKTGGFLSTLKTILTGGSKISGSAGIIGALDLFNKGQKDAELYSSGAFDAISVVGNAIMEAGEKSGASAWKMSQLQGQISEFQNGSLTFDEAFKKIIENLDDAGISSDEFKIALENSMQQVGLTTGEYATLIQSYIGQVGTSFGNASKDSDSMKNDVIKNTDVMKSNLSKDLFDISSNVESSFGNVNDTTVLNWGNSAREVTLKLREMKLAASTELGNMTETVRSFSESMYNIMTKKFEYLGTRIKQLIENMNNNTDSVFESMLSGMSEDARRITNDIANSFSRLSDKIYGSLSSDMYYAGRNAAIEFANGISSVHIPMPHIDVNASTWRTGDGYSYSMNSSVNWYKAGGLFGMPSVIGVGEAGKEAVLPLENQRTMSMIADSIMSRAPQAAIDQKMIENAVTRGVAMAMMNNQQNPINVTCYAELKTENDEVLARAVTRGQEKLDYRMNPTPRFGY